MDFKQVFKKLTNQKNLPPPSLTSPLLEELFSTNLPLASLANFPEALLLFMVLLDLFMDFLQVDLERFFAPEDIFSAKLPSESLTNFPEALLLFMVLLDLFMDFLGIDLDPFLALEALF